ncbi:MAG: cytochrome c maturation protein CcmE [Cytophagales bacterium]
MKITHLLILGVIAVATVIIITATGDASTYVTFSEAIELKNNGKKSEVHVVGKLRKTSNGEIIGMEYFPTIDPNYFAFNLVDTNQTVMKVIYNKPKPADFEKSEQVVVIGSVKDSTTFLAKDILMKCPSKYTETEIKESSAMLN